jgi:hypothetical protein
MTRWLGCGLLFALLLGGLLGCDRSTEPQVINPMPSNRFPASQTRSSTRLGSALVPSPAPSTAKRP